MLSPPVFHYYKPIMCGFVSICSKTGAPIRLSVLREMAQTIHHRGPDEEDHLIDGPVGFYHKRLAVIDLESGQQPMTRGGVTIVFNGQIYNYKELREELKRAGCGFSTQSDTEVLLQMYRHWGLDCLQRLNGMFAFVIYDRGARRILAVRDRLGIKPLYVFEDDRRLLFASEIKALLAHPEVPAEPNTKALQEYLVFQYLLNGTTFFKGIEKIDPGFYHLVDLDSFSRKKVKYWELDFNVDTNHTEEYFIQTLRELIEDSVRLRLQSDVPLGTTLSGGMDSSIITLLASSRLSHPIKTYTGAFREGREFDESGYAREAAAAGGCASVLVYPDEKEFMDELPRLVHLMDEPAGGPGLFPQYMVSRRAAEDVKVLLGGQGGDEIFGGYTRYVVAYLEQALKGAIFETNDEGVHIVNLQSILPNLPVIQNYIPLMRHFWKDGLFDPMDLRYFRLIDRSRGNRDILTDDFNAGFDNDHIFSRFQTIFHHPQTLSYYNKMVHYDLVTNLPALLQVEDRTSMANSVESRVPFLDHRIVELVTTMPPSLKFKGAEMKYILKRAMKDILPPRIYNRKDKMGFPVPLHLWAKKGLKSFLKDLLLSSASRNRGIFDPAGLERLIDNEDKYGRSLWGFLNIELWFRTFIDGRASKKQGKGAVWTSGTGL